MHGVRTRQHREVPTFPASRATTRGTFDQYAKCNTTLERDQPSVSNFMWRGSSEHLTNYMRAANLSAL